MIDLIIKLVVFVRSSDIEARIAGALSAREKQEED
jgi:hypothetical protein